MSIRGDGRGTSTGLPTAPLDEELLRGDRAALGLAGLAGSFRAVRVVLDLVWFSHEDWPRGRLLVLGHLALTGLFCALALPYLGLLLWHATGGP